MGKHEIVTVQMLDEHQEPMSNVVPNGGWMTASRSAVWTYVRATANDGQFLDLPVKTPEQVSETYAALIPPIDLKDLPMTP